MARGAKAPGPCTYCQRVGPLTRDHVPPKLLFPNPRPSTLVTVPSCRSCNEEAGLDDTHFRLHIALRDHPDPHPDVEVIRGEALRDLGRAEAAGLKQRFLDDMALGQKRTGHPRAYSPETVRLARVASRTAKGLYFHHTRVAMPRDILAIPVIDERFAAAETDFQELGRRVWASVGRSWIRIGTIFEYSYRILEDESYVSAWALRFFNTTEFLVLTGNAGHFKAPVREASFPPPTGGYQRKKPFPRRPPPPPKLLRQK